MQIFIRKPDIERLVGVKVTKDTDLSFENEHVKQTVKGLEFHSVTKKKGDKYESTIDTIIHLEEGDVLVYEEEDRGYILPVEEFVSIDEAIDDLVNIKDLGGAV